MDKRRRTCIACERDTVYGHTTSAGSGSAPQLLPGLGGVFSQAKIEIYACSSCGRMELVVPEEFRGKIPDSNKWQKI